MKTLTLLMAESVSTWYGIFNSQHSTRCKEYFVCFWFGF
jgi:hypothetical protein